MEVQTQSAIALNAQRSVMEFLLINHPLDCPICDQGGECELQDLSVGYGSASSNYDDQKRSVYDEDLGPLVGTNMTRCIQCTRCVRFGQEISGQTDLGQIGRGNVAEISTYIKEGLKSELSANVIDLCPVGALTNKPYRFSHRSWELEQKAGIAPHDCVGSNIYMHISNKAIDPVSKLVRVVPQENAAVNETWIADRDRFSFCGLTSDDRILKPAYKTNNLWREVGWDFSLNLIIDRLTALKQSGQLASSAFLASNTLCNEDFLCMTKLAKGFESEAIVNNLRCPSNFTLRPEIKTALPSLLETVAQAKVVVVLGSDVRRKQPMLNHRIRQAQLNGAEVVYINSQALDVNYPIQTTLTLNQTDTLALLSELSQEPLSDTAKELSSLMQKHAQQVVWLVGEDVLSQSKGLDSWTNSLAELENKFGAQVVYLTDGPNYNGQKRILSSLATASMQLSLGDLVEKSKQFYVLQQLEPEHDALMTHELMAHLKDAFVVVLSNYKTKQMEEYADVILPVPTYAEVAGSYNNINDDMQAQVAASAMVGDVRPAWKIYTVIAKLMGISGFEYQSHADVQHAFTQLPEQIQHLNLGDHAINLPAQTYQVIPFWGSQQVDAVVRRSEPLQTAATDRLEITKVSADIAETIGLKQRGCIQLHFSDFSVEMIAQVDDALASKTLVIPMDSASSSLIPDFSTLKSVTLSGGSA